MIKPLLSHYPEPNLPGNQFTFPFSQPTNEHYGQVRADHTFSSSDTFFARYTVDDTSETRSGTFPQFAQVFRSRYQWGTLSESHVFSPVLLNTFRYSYSKTLSVNNPVSSGLLGPQFSLAPGQEIGSVSVGGLSGFGAQAPGGVRQNLFTWSDDLFYTRGDSLVEVRDTD